MATDRFSFRFEEHVGMLRQIGIFASTLMFAVSAFAAVAVTDDEGNTVSLPNPAKRVISLAPHTTEMMYAIGAGKTLVGVASRSDYPEEVRSLPVVGDFRQIDLERVLVLKPDLLVVWSGGSSPKQLEKLKQAGIAVFHSHPRHLKDIPDNMTRLGILTAHEVQAGKVSRQWMERLGNLEKQYRNRTPLRVFYQVSDAPLFTLNGKQIVSEAIGLCGGKNVFADMPVLAPNVSRETVLAANPEVIVATQGMGAEDGLAGWKAYGMVDAVRYGNLFGIHPDWLDRPGPRMIEGVEELCRMLDRARKNRQ